MVLTLASILAVIFVFLSGLHFYWVFGGKWGLDSAIPSNGDKSMALKPSVIATLIVGTGLLSFALFYLIKMGVLSFSLPSWLLLGTGWVLPSIFLIRVIGDFKYVGLFKKIKTTTFAKSDTKYFIPLCAFLAIAGFIVQMYS